MHPWHDIDPLVNALGETRAIIEISKGSQVKYEIDKDSGLLKMDRVLYSAVHYPADYGFIPRTLWHDQDPMDIFVLGSFPVVPMTIVQTRIIGIIRMEDNSEGDDKLLSVYTGDPRFDEYRDLEDIPQHTVRELKHFLETYKDLQGKKVTVMEIKGRESAQKALEESLLLYQNMRAQIRGN
jgi:inorganic pyrophosphatase